MALLIGTDEAGYGPNLGPLVISATAWQVPDERINSDLYALLGRVVCKTAMRGEGTHVAIADSKKLYKPGGGLAPLERGVLACLRAMGDRATSWREVWRSLAPESVPSLDAEPWHADFDVPVPRDVEPQAIDQLASRMAAECQACGVSLGAIRSCAIFPQRWNDLLDRHGSKGEVLARATLQLVKSVRAAFGAAPTLIQCDKFGGRNRYTGLLQTVFPEYLAEPIEEGRAVSVYRWGPQPCRVEWRFAAGGEDFLPTALASMTSKYLRELAMLAFNQFWMRMIPGLKPTAGYPVDARRFKAEIGPVQNQLGINDRLLWRRK